MIASDSHCSCGRLALRTARDRHARTAEAGEKSLTSCISFLYGQVDSDPRVVDSSKERRQRVTKPPGDHDRVGDIDGLLRNPEQAPGLQHLAPHQGCKPGDGWSLR